MLTSAETIDVIADVLASHHVPQVVLDPVACSPGFVLISLSEY